MRLVRVYLFFLVTLTEGFAPRTPAQPWTQYRANAGGEGLGLNKPPMELCDESATQVMDEIRNELGTIFGYTADSRAVGITGEIDLIEVDGPTMVVALRGRFWHATDTVMMRVESYIKNRIPEVIDVILDTKNSQIQDDNRLNTDGGKKRLF